MVIKNPQGEPCGLFSIGGPGGIRTPDLLVRSYALNFYSLTWFTNRNNYSRFQQKFKANVTLGLRFTSVLFVKSRIDYP